MDRRTTALAIAAAVVIGLGLRLAFWTGTIASDDLTHAWAATHVWSDPIEHRMPDGAASPYVVNARRVGVNLPLAAAAAIGGANEVSFAAATLLESLAGIVACALFAGALAGRRAAVLAAALTAVTPIDVWQATIFLQDTLWATGLAAVLAAWAWAVRTERRRWWWLAGLGLGYLQYVKESAAVLAATLVVIGVVRSVRARRIDRGTVALLGGVVVIHALAGLYWWSVAGDPLAYLRAWLGRQSDVEAGGVMRPFPHNLARLGLYLGYHQALGVGLLVAAGFAVRWLRRGDAPARLRHDLVVIALVQLAVLVHVLRWGAWTQRYLLQVTPLVIAIGAAGIMTAWPARRRAVIAVAVVGTALGLVIGRPQHDRRRADVIRQAAWALATRAPSDTPVYVVLGPHPGHYADRALDLIDHMRHPRYGTISDPRQVRRGLLVWSHLERHRQRPEPPPGARLVFTAETGGGRQWVDVFAVGP